MPAINLPDDLYKKLAAVAAGLGQTVDEHVTRMLGPAETIITPAERDALIADADARARARAHLYPPGFECDISREAMYPDENDE